MKLFFELNNQKFKFIIKFIFLAFFILTSALYFGKFVDNPNIILLIVFHLLLSVGLTILISGLIFLTGYLPYSLQEKLFKKKEINDLFQKYDFKSDLIYATNKWQLTQEIKKGVIDLCPIVFFRSQRKRNAIDVVLEFEWTPKDQEINNLKNSFKENNFTIEPGWVLKTISMEDNIEETIKGLIVFIRDAGLKPKLNIV